MSNMNIAKTIMGQLGGSRLAVMTGAKNFLAVEGGVSFRIGRNSKGVNYVKVILNAMDLYDIEYGRVYGTKYTVKAESKDVYNDQLKDNFEINTGMYLSF